MDHVYAKGWFRAKCRPLELLTPDDARSLHESGKVYAVLAGGELPDRPELFLEINRALSWVGVTFLDSRLRPFLDYSFANNNADAGPLFLERAVYREFTEGSDDPIATVYCFKPDGSLHIEKSDQSDTIQCREAVNPIDVCNNWEPMPEFGDYDSIARRER